MYRGPGWSEARGGPRPILDFEFFRGSLDSRITFTRSTSGTYFNSAGVLVTAAVNIPRFDHKPSDSNATLGLLLEEARTNICLQSEALGTTWTNPGANTTITNNAGAAPDGATTAEDVLHLDSAETIQQAITATDNTIYAISAFVKQGLTGSHDFVKMAWIDNATGLTGFEAWFDLSTGSVGTAQAKGTGTYVTSSAKMESVGSGWYRISAAGQLPLGTTGARFEIINTTADAVDTAEATNSVLWWGLQAEIGPFATSYIPTTTLAVARGADLATLLLANTGFVQATASYFVEMDFASSASQLTGQWALSVNDDSFNNAHDLALDDGTESVPRFFVFSGGSAIGNVAITGVAEKTLFKVAWAVKENDLSATINGGTITQDSTVTPMPTGMTKLKIGRRGNDSQNFTGHIRKLRIYNARLPDGVLIELTR